MQSESDEAVNTADAEADDNNAEPIKATVSYEVTIPNDWFNYIILNQDVFRTDCCGYWARGVEFDEALGWLVWEHGDDYAPYEEEPNREAAIAAWQSGPDAPLPNNWFRLDRAAGIKAFVEGCRKYGADWYEDSNTDATTYDTVIQLALLGEVRYG